MHETTTALIPLLRFCASTGAGVLASLLFASLRRYLPLDRAARLPGGALWSRLLYAPLYVRFVTLALPGLIAIPFGVALALAEQRAPLPVVDALLAAVIAQLWHALTDLVASVPVPTAELVADEDQGAV